MFKTDGVGTPSDQPALLFSNILTEKNPPPNAGTGVNYGLYMNSATLKIQNGATLTTSIGSASSSSSKSVFLGNSGTATVEVSGTGSTATFNQRVALGGGAGQGTTLTIRDGGTVNASSTAIAGINGQASVLVDGGTFNAGTSATVGSFNIGNYGAGTLTIRNNGVVTNGLSAAIIGNQATAVGTVGIDSGSWTSSAQIETGSYGKGSLNISGGTVTDTIGYIGRYAGGEGTVTVNGTGKWINSSGLYIGNSGTGTLNFSGATATLTPGSSTNYISRAAARPAPPISQTGRAGP